MQDTYFSQGKWVKTVVNIAFTPENIIFTYEKVTLIEQSVVYNNAYLELSAWEKN